MHHTLGIFVQPSVRKMAQAKYKRTTMKNTLKSSIAVLVLSISSIAICSTSAPQWGFYGHRLINKMAVFCLPQEVLGFYKKNIDYLAEHAVDPDKRRYATRHEAVRHYIDIDAWGEFPFYEVPRNITSALIKYSHYYLVNGTDTTQLSTLRDGETLQLIKNDSIVVYEAPSSRFSNFFYDKVYNQYYEDEWIVDPQTVQDSLGLDGQLLVEDHFSKEGILPYHLMAMKRKLTRAFEERNQEQILRISAEFGHYIGDAHVPLHTTRNYNGQLTDQVGIHGFWESRIPELFAEAEYSFIVGRAEYIENTNKYFWNVVLESHKQLEDVLAIEKELSLTFPSDKQYCYDDRLGRTIRVQCPEYAAAYQNRMNGMVEARMQDAILSIASVWYTCWVDGGQPDLSVDKLSIVTEEIVPDAAIKTREHE